MDKFVTRTPRVGADVSNKRPASSEAAGATGAPTTKKAKALAPKQQGVKWTKARLIGVEAASYQDQTLAFTTLQDGRELLLGEEVWALPRGASAGAPGALKSLEKVGAMGGDRFAALPGLDAAAVVVGSGFGKEPQRLTLCELPSGKEVVADVPLPGIGDDRGYGGGGFIRAVHAVARPDGRGVSILVVTPQRLFSLTAANGDAGVVACSLEGSIDVARGPVAKHLRGGSLQATALYVGPDGERFALVGHNGVVSVIPLAGDAASSPPPRSVTMHGPLKKSDKDATVFDIAVWRDGGRGTKMVTVGSDGHLSVCALDDGTNLAEHRFVDDQWHATSSGSGPSKQYRYAAAHRVTVDANAGVALTGSQFEPVAHLWDLRSTKSSAKGKLLCSTPKLATGAPRKVTIMCTAASSTTGLFAYSNSNDADDATLKFVVPTAAKK